MPLIPHALPEQDPVQALSPDQEAQREDEDNASPPMTAISNSDDMQSALIYNETNLRSPP